MPAGVGQQMREAEARAQSRSHLCLPAPAPRPTAPAMSRPPLLAPATSAPIGSEPRRPPGPAPPCSGRSWWQPRRFLCGLFAPLTLTQAEPKLLSYPPDTPQPAGPRP